VKRGTIGNTNSKAVAPDFFSRGNRQAGNRCQIPVWAMGSFSLNSDYAEKKQPKLTGSATGVGKAAFFKSNMGQKAANRKRCTTYLGSNMKH